MRPGDTLYRFYGEDNPPLTGSIVGLVTGDNITASYNTTATPTSLAGGYTVFVTLNDPDNRLGNYTVTKNTGALSVQRAPQTITFGAIPSHAYGDAPFTVPVSASSGLPVTLTSSAAFVATVSGTTLTVTGAGTTLLTAYQPGDANYQAAAFQQVSCTVGKATPVITWATPGDINCRTVLGGVQLNVTVNAPGTSIYNPPAGTTLGVGDAQVLSASFTPANSANYNSVSATTTVNVRLHAGAPPGNPDVSFDTGSGVAGYQLRMIAVKPDGKAVICGWFTTINGVSRNRIARLNSNGSLDSSFDLGSGANQDVYAVALQADGKMLIGGDFTSINGVARALIARVELGPDAPTVTLNGPTAGTLEYNTPFADPGATAVDACGDSLPVTVTGTVDALTAGAYTLTYLATDAAGQSGSATRTVTVVMTDHPPVAVLGGDLTLRAATDCLAQYYPDGSASYDPNGEALAYEWRVYNNEGAPLKFAVPVDSPPDDVPAYFPLDLGTYTVELTVSTTRSGVTASSTDTQVVTVLAGAPVLTTMTPAAAYATGAAFNLTVTGGCFLEGATVHLNGSPRPTTVVSSSELATAIPASDLQTGVDIAVATVQVVNGDGQVSNPLGFSIVAQTVGSADATVAQPGQTSTVSTAPATAGEPGVSVTVENGGDTPVTVLAATYDTKPVGETAFRVDNGAFVDVQVAGAGEEVSATVFFYYPSDVTGGMENRVKLRYFNGVDWIPVLSSGGLPPAKVTSDNLDGTVSGGRFTVIFDMTSTPKITALSGTVFGMFESQPPLGAIAGPIGPVALGQGITVSVDFVALGDAGGVWARFIWDDGLETVMTPQAAGSAQATHLYAAPGVYGVTVQVTDGEGDLREGRFEYVVIYDPNGGFVTGGGWIDSPAGAYVFDATLAGRATFGFTSRYQKGQSAPTGQTQFQFQAGDFRFHSTAYEWLVVAGAKAQYKGIGQVNGAGDYGFLLTATDGQVNGGGGTDRFRIKIRDRASGVVVYDNRLGLSEDMNSADPQPLGGGSIVIHKSK